MRVKIVLFLCSIVLASCGNKDLSQPGDNEEADLNRCLRFSAKKRYEQAIECLEIFKSRYPASAHTAEAELRIGDSYFRKKEYLLAAESYRQFIRLHPSHERVDYAYYRLGLSYLQDTPKQIDRDQSSLEEALSALETVWRSYPYSAYAKIARLKYDDASAQQADHELYVARFYFRTKEYRAAIPRLALVTENYRDTPYALEAAYLKVKAHLALRELENAQQVLAYLQLYFPNAKETRKAEKKLRSSL